MRLGAWLPALLALGLMLCSLAQKAYRLTLPTDGWSFTTGAVGGIDEDRPTFHSNLLGLDSPLQRGDRLLAVEGRLFEQILAQAYAGEVQTLPAWRAGQTVAYSVERQGVPTELQVPLGTWTLSSIARQLLASPDLWVATALAALGWLVFLKRPSEWAARALLLFSICQFVTGVSSAVVDWSLPELLTPGLFAIALFFSNWIFAVVMFPSLLLLTLVFPRPKAFVQRRPRRFLILLIGLIPLLLVLIGPNPTLGWVSVLLMALLSLAAIIHSLVTVRDRVGRAQVHWAVGGLGLMVLGFIPVNLAGLGWWPAFPPWLELIWFPMLLMIMTLGFAVAILRYRLFEIDLLINRTLVYGILTTLVIVLYIVLVGYLGALFRTETNLLISLVATGIVAVCFQPLRERLQRSVNRLMYGQRDEPMAVLTTLGAQMEATLAPQESLPVLVETIASTLKLPYVAIALRVGEQWKLQAESGNPVEGIESFPLVHQGQQLGQLQVGLRAPGERFNAADRLLLTNIARQAGAAAHAVQLTIALQQSRRQLVSAREEERRRLRRDLHDGLGPQLASHTLTLEAIDKLLERDAAKVKELLNILKEQSQAATQEVRRLVYGLRPPALDELGLVGALQEGIRHYGNEGCSVEIATEPQPLPPLPAAVEVALYRIAQEALTNVIRHAHAASCRVLIQVQEHAVELTVRDDGSGIAPHSQAGVGLHAMRERAEELGGRLRVENHAAGGAHVQLWLPLPGDEG